MAYKNDYLHDKYNSENTTHKSKTARVHASVSKNTRKKPNYKLRKWLFGSVIALTLFLLLFWQPVSDISSVAFSSASSEIKQAGRDAGLNTHGQAIFLNNEPEFVNADTLASACPHDKEIIEYGCYLPSSHKIYILQINDNELKPIELVAVAHETLHAAWNDMSLDDQQTIISDLTTFYDSKVSPALTKDAKPYKKENSTVFVDELHSLSGSEVGLVTMPSSLQNHFSKYFSEQDLAVQAGISFDRNIGNQITDINTRKKQLDLDSQELNNYQAAHLDNIKAYMQQNLYYGDTYTYNKNVDAYNNNRDIYNDMVARYNDNVNSYNATRQNFVNAYSALFPNKSIPVGGAK